MNRIVFHYIVWSLFLFFEQGVAAVQPFVLNTSIEEQKIAGRYIESIEIDGDIPLNNASKSQDWKILGDQHAFVIKNPERFLWLRFALQNKESKPVKYYLEFADSHNSIVQLFKVNALGGVDSVGKIGFDEPFSSRVFDHKNFIYDVSLSAGETQVVYVKIKSRYQSYFGIKLISDHHLVSYFYQEYYWLGIFYGILFIMAMYNLFLFVSTRESVYVYYVLYVMSCALYTGSEDTILFQYFWPEQPWLNHLFFLIATSLVLILGPCKS